MKKVLLLAGLAALAGRRLPAQGVVTGTVREDSTGRPLPGVEVVVAGSERRAVTDTRGRYSLSNLPAGRRMVLFRRVGYRPAQEWVDPGSGDTLWVNPTLVAQAVALDPVVVTARPVSPRGSGVEAFEERRRLGFGQFLDSTVLRRNENQPLVGLLGRMQGIGFGFVPGEKGQIAAVSQRRFGPMGEPCFMAVILDGVVLYNSVAPGLGGGGGGGRPPPDLKMFSTSSVEAVELYRGAGEVPMEFGGTGAACGVLVLWTRHP